MWQMQQILKQVNYSTTVNTEHICTFLYRMLMMTYCYIIVNRESLSEKRADKIHNEEM